MRLPTSSTSLLATFLISLPHSALGLQSNLAGVIDWHQPKIGIPLLHSSATAPSFVPLPSTNGANSTSIVTITKSNVVASLDPSSGNINWRHQLREGEVAQNYHSSPSSASIVLLSTTLEGGSIRLIDSATGHFIWETTAFTSSSEQARDAEVASLSDVAFGEDGSIFVLVDASDVYKLDEKTGSVVWSYKTGGDSLWSRLVLSSNHLSLVGSVNTFTGYALKTLRLNPTTSEIITSPGHFGSIDSPTSFLIAGSSLVWLEDKSVYTISLETSSPKPQRTLSAFTSLEGLGLEKEGYFLGTKKDGQAEVLKTEQDQGTVLAYTFDSVDSPEASSSTYNGFVNATGSVFVGRTFWSHSLKLANVHVYSFEGEGQLSGHTFPFDTVSHGVILHTALHVASPREHLDVIGLFLTTSSGAVQLYEHGQLRFTKEESLAEIKSVVFVDLPEQEVLQQASRDDEPFADRLLRHVVEARHLPAYLARFASRLVSSSSAASVLTASPSTSTEDGLFRDQFGFRKLLVVGTSTGKVFGLDSSNGNIVWSKLLGKSVVEGGSLDISGVFVTRPAKTGLRPRVAIIGSSILDAEENTVAFEIDSLSGDILRQAPTLFGGRPSEVIPLVVNELVGKSLAVLDKDSKVHFFPRPPTTVESQDFVITRATLDGGRQSLQAFRVSTNASPSEVWKLPFAEGESIYSIEATSQDPIASFGRILGDRSAFYKYLNPHLLAVSTISPATSEGTVYLVDGTRGTIVYQVSHANLDTSAGIELSLLENWLVYRYRVEGLVATAGVSTGNRVVTVELFERGVAADKIGSSELTSYSAEHDLNILSKTFILPSGIKAIGTTSTKHGITSKEVIIADSRNQLHSIPRRLLDPRRPHGKPAALDREEQLVPYDPIISLDPKRTLSHAYELLGVSHILTSPALLESTSLVFAYGLDLFSTRVMPSGTFDILSDSFNKAQLVLTILGLSVGIVAVKPIVERKKSRAKWF